MISEQQAIQERQKYVMAWNETMIKIWKEQITLLDVIDTGRLLNSPVSLRTQADGKFSEVQLSQAFLEYGLWQDYGTGKEVARGNAGDIGIGDIRTKTVKKKVRQRKPWFSNKYYASVMNIKDFMADSLGRQFQGIIADALDSSKFRYNHKTS